MRGIPVIINQPIRTIILSHGITIEIRVYVVDLIEGVGKSSYRLEGLANHSTKHGTTNVWLHRISAELSSH